MRLESEFSYETIIDYEPGVTRRDPSPVIRVGDLYYVWYTKATRDPSGYFGTIWYATSPDGHSWREVGEALGTGDAGAWDEHAVFTPTILVAGGRYYLFYTAVPSPFTNDNGGPGATPTAIGVASSDSPDGPWARCAGSPVIRPGEGDAFDSHRVDDACCVVREGRIWLYYKGRQAGLSPAETKMGVASADRPEGPYEKYAANPVLPSGHEVCVWPHGSGVAAIVSPCGPLAKTVQYAADGIHFETVGHIEPPKVPGPYRADNFEDGAGPGVAWGVCQGQGDRDRPYLMRFDCDLRAS